MFTSKAANEIGKAVKQSVTSAVNNKKEKIVFNSLPESYEEFISLPQASMSTPYETDGIAKLFVVALSKLLVDREALLEDGRLIRHELMDTAAIDTECEELLHEMDVVAGLIQKCINENAVKAIDQDEYISRYNSLVERHEKAQNRYDTLQKKRDRRLIQSDVMSGFLFAITELDNLQLQFNPPLWHTTVDHVTVYTDEHLVFHFKNGSEVEVVL